VFVRDTIQGLQIVLLLWMYFTPIFYSVDLVQANLSANSQILYNLNPMVVIVTGYRNSLLHLNQPSPVQIGLVLAASLAVFIAGGLLFRQTKPAFPDVL
jgi:ABC-type polysaccharide/polyol phosphate export permease